MKLKKLLAGFMAACMVATAVPVTAFAAIELPDAEDGIINVTDNIEVIGEGNSMTVELDNETIQFASGKGFIVAKGGTLEITGTGTISEVADGEEGDLAPIRVYGGGTVVVEGDITLEGWAGIMVRQQGKDGMTDCGNDDINVTLTGVTLKGVSDGDGANGLYVNGGVDGENNVITLNNPEIISDGDGIYQAGMATTVLNGGTVEGETCGIVISAGDMTIKGNPTVEGGTGKNNSESGTGGAVDASNIGLAVIQHTTGHDVNVTVESGTFTGGTAIIASENLEATEDGDVVVTLDGGTFTASCTETTYDYAMKVMNGAEVTVDGATLEVEDGYGVYIKGLGDDSDETTTLNVESGTITATDVCYAIAGNGSSKDGVDINGGTEINISGGTITSDQVAIYHPQNGTLNISGGEITGATAVYAMDGDINISGGTLKGTGEGEEADEDNGATGTGAAIVIESDDAYISSEKDTLEPNITGGTFVGTVAVETKDEGLNAKTEFISGGNFSSSLADTVFLVEELTAELELNSGDAPFSYHTSTTADTIQETLDAAKESGIVRDLTTEDDEGITVNPTPSKNKTKKYDVIIKNADNGDVEVDDDYAKRGQEITITVDPDKGYELDELTITDQNGDEVDYEEGKKDNTFVFDMPKSDVTIEASFDKESSSVSDQDDDDKEDVSDKEDEDTSKSDDEQEYIKLTIGQKIVWLFDEYVVNDVAPEIKAERTMLPIRIIAEALGATVTWSEAEQKVTITEEDLVIEIFIDQPFATVDGEPVELDAPAYIANDRTYLPLRFVAENLGAEVVWNAADSSVTIYK